MLLCLAVYDNSAITDDTDSDFPSPSRSCSCPVKDLRSSDGGGGNDSMLKRNVLHARRPAPLLVNEICFGRCTSEPERMCVSEFMRIRYIEHENPSPLSRRRHSRGG